MDRILSLSKSPAAPSSLLLNLPGTLMQTKIQNVKLPGGRGTHGRSLLPAHVKQLTGFAIAVHPAPPEGRGQLPFDPLRAFLPAATIHALRQHHV